MVIFIVVVNKINFNVVTIIESPRSLSRVGTTSFSNDHQYRLIHFHYKCLLFDVVGIIALGVTSGGVTSAAVVAHVLHTLTKTLLIYNLEHSFAFLDSFCIESQLQVFCFDLKDQCYVSLYPQQVYIIPPLVNQSYSLLVQFLQLLLY